MRLPLNLRSAALAAWRLLPTVHRRLALSAVASWLAPRPDKLERLPRTSHGVAIAGEFTRASGLGESARLMATAAEQLGIRVWRLDVPSPIGDPMELPFPKEDPPPPGVPLIIHVNSPLLPIAVWRLSSRAIRGRRIVGCWYWEVPGIPREWNAGVPFIHEIWAPSRFTRDALKPLLPGHVKVVPPAMTAAPPQPARLNRAAFGWPSDAVVVLVSFDISASARKNPVAAIAAFKEAFGNQGNRLLVLKINHAHHSSAEFTRLAELAQAPNIRIETRTMPTADCHAMTAAADIVLSLHRSEGFGLVPAEAMFLGKPVVATAWSGCMDYMDADTVALVRYRLVPTDDPRKVYRNSVWADPDIGDAADHLQRLADNPENRYALGARAAAGVRQHLHPGPLAQSIASLGVPVPGLEHS